MAGGDGIYPGISAVSYTHLDVYKRQVSAWSKYFALQDELYQTIYQMTSIKEEKQNIFNFVGEKEDAINSLQNRIRTERLIYLGIFICMLAAYVVEYLILKKKFLLFK